MEQNNSNSLQLLSTIEEAELSELVKYVGKGLTLDSLAYRDLSHFTGLTKPEARRLLNIAVQRGLLELVAGGVSAYVRPPKQPKQEG